MRYIPSWERRAEERGKEMWKEAGAKEEKKATAIKLLKKGMKFDFIADVTGFPINKIEKLAAEAH